MCAMCRSVRTGVQKVRVHRCAVWFQGRHQKELQKNFAPEEDRRGAEEAENTSFLSEDP